MHVPLLTVAPTLVSQKPGELQVIGVPTHCLVLVHASLTVLGLPSSHACPVAAGYTQLPLLQVAPTAVSHRPGLSQVIGVPTQTPLALQVSLWVQAFPSSHWLPGVHPDCCPGRTGA